MVPQGRRQVEQAVCPEHPGSRVVSIGIRKRSDGVSRRYRCAPAVGDRHTFTVRLTTERRLAAWSPPPPCRKHPGSKVIRFGTYGKSTAKPRQRYQCQPVDGSKPHVFTPPLPRDHVHANEEHCDICDELRGVHHGETAAARGHSWSTRIVVRGLEYLVAGASYASVGRWAKRAAKVDRRRALPPLDPATVVKGRKQTKPKGEAAREARRSWHIAADWVEVFGPVIYDPVDAWLRAEAYAERERLDEQWANGEVLDRPQVILVDDVPVYGRDLDTKNPRRDEGFFINVLAEAHWDNDTASTAKLRLVRGMPKSNTPAWRLMFDELGYEPDFIVADAGTGIVNAIEEHFDPTRTKFIPSLWHMRNRIDDKLRTTKGAHTRTQRGKVLIEPLDEHLRHIGRYGSALADEAAWEDWWDDLEAILKRHRLPVDAIRRQRANNEEQVANVLADIHRYPGVPISTGGLETLITKWVKPQLAMRRMSFANIERTNTLFDLVVAAHHGALDDTSEVVRLLRRDTAAYDGWAPPLRAIADPRPPRGRNSSLRDVTLLNDLAAERGLL